MSWIWEKSSLWRRIVYTTKQSPLAMAGFTVVAFAVPYYVGKLVLQVNLVTCGHAQPDIMRDWCAFVCLDDALAPDSGAVHVGACRLLTTGTVACMV